MERGKAILVLTGTINPNKFNPPNTVIKNYKTRLNQYLYAIKSFLENSLFDIIIFVENSNYKYDYNQLFRLAESRGKDLEILSFQGDKKMISQRGKGYGEGEIIEYALKNSKYLENREAVFYKATGRLYVTNINKIIKNTPRKNYFLEWGPGYCLTSIFKCSIDFYKKNLIYAYKQVNDNKGECLEKIFHRIIKKGRDELNRFPEYPRIRGFSASTGEKYEMGFRWLVRNMKLKMGFYDIK